MVLFYNRIGKLLVGRMSKAILKKAADIVLNMMVKLRRDEAINLAILGYICKPLDCDFDDIMECVKGPK